MHCMGGRLEEVFYNQEDFDLTAEGRKKRFTEDSYLSSWVCNSISLTQQPIHTFWAIKGKEKQIIFLYISIIDFFLPYNITFEQGFSNFFNWSTPWNQIQFLFTPQID